MGEGRDEGARSLVAGFELLRKDSEQTGRRAGAATDAVRHVKRNHREAMAELRQVDGVRGVCAGQVLHAAI